MTIAESQEAYINSKKGIGIIEKKIELKYKQIERLNLKKQKINDKNWWGDALIRPILEMVKSKFPQITDWDDESLTPMGMKNRVSVFGKHNDNTIGITFTLNNYEEGILAFENGMKEPNYVNSYKTIYDLNGFCYKDEPILDIEQVYNYIEKQLI
jgi:hypothetical protein